MQGLITAGTHCPLKSSKEKKRKEKHKRAAIPFCCNRFQTSKISADINSPRSTDRWFSEFLQ